MKYLRVGLMVGLCGFLARGAFGQPVQWAGNGHFYEAVYAPGGINWYQAEAAAEADGGGYLATILSSNENAFVYSLVAYPQYWQQNSQLNNSEGPWLGGYKSNSVSPATGWNWVHGDGPFVYTNWQALEPDNSGGNEDRLDFFNVGSPMGPYWNDISGYSTNLGYVIEWDGTPVSAPPLTITTQPQSQTVASGASVSFSVAAVGLGPLTYEWQFNGVDVGPTNDTITTFAGGGQGGDGSAATNANLFSPRNAVEDAAGNVYIADQQHNSIRKVATSGIITTVAGNGEGGYSGDSGQATTVSLQFPFGVAVDSSGDLFIADFYNQRIRKVDTNGFMKTVAGSGSAGPGGGAYAGDGGPATSARLNEPECVVVDAAGNLFIADYLNNRIRKVDTNGIITTVAGNGTAAFSGDGGQATNASLSGPNGVGVDGFGNVFIADSVNGRVREMNTAGIITTVAGGGTNGLGDNGPATNAVLTFPTGVTVDIFGNLFIVDEAGNRVREVAAGGIITTVAGDGSQGFSGDGGPATNASLNSPYQATVDGFGNLFIADQANNRVRKVTLNVGPALAIYNVSSNNAGNYTVIVSNPYQSVTSSVAVLTVNPPPPPIVPSTNDLWDISQGSVVTGTSGADTPYSDIRDMFGGMFSEVEPGDTIFEDGEPPGFVHYVEWRTPGPVTVSSFNLFAAGDGSADNNEREFAQFVLKAKSGPLATNFDLTLYTLVVTNHPYTFVDPTHECLISANITPVTAQYFRAEFTQYTAGRGFDGPRVVELDGFGDNPPVVVSGPNSTETYAGSGATFSVVATGTAPLSYQWQENMTNIPAALNPTATNATLVLANVNAGQSGNVYSVLITNSQGSTNSTNAVLTVLSPGSCFPPPAGIISWWPGEKSGVDIIGTNNGTLVGGVTFAPGEVAEAFNINGPSQYVDVPNSPSLNPTSSVTVEAWINLRQESGSKLPIMIKGGEGSNPIHGYSLEFDNPGGLAFYVYVNGAWVGTPHTLISTNQWTHVAGVYDGSAVYLYVNGVLAGTPTPLSGLIMPSGNDLQIGHDPTVASEVFNGLIDEPTLYGVALTAAQIQDIYDAGSAGKCSEPEISVQPASQVGLWGGNVTLSVSAAGSGPFTYQWNYNGAPIANATNATLTLGDLQFASAGAYTVTVGNQFGSQTSAPANLTVNPAGVSIALYAGIDITGTPGLTYGVQYSTDLNNTNAWLGLANVTLSETNELYFDLTPAQQQHRYYRVVPGPISIP